MVYELFQGFKQGPKGKKEGGDERHPRPSSYSFSFLNLSERSKLEEHLRQGGIVALHLFEIQNFQIFSQMYGSEISSMVEDFLHHGLKGLADEYCGDCRFCYVERMSRGRCLVLCGKDSYSVEKISDTTQSIRLKLKRLVRDESLKLTGQAMELVAGHSAITSLVRDSLEHALYNALCDAQKILRGDLDESSFSLLTEFREILEKRSISSVYQPLVSFASGRTMGWEALTRGPANSYFSNPAALFDFAEETGHLFALEKVCRETAIANLGDMEKDLFLFLNIHPRTMVDPGFSSGETAKLLEEVGLAPENVVFEITERHSISDFTLFHRTLEHYRGQGYRVAVDDVGTGYSGLWSIAELRPDFVKIDMSLIRDIDKNPVKRALIETFVTFAEKIGCRLIAEGIETEHEMSCLADMGVHFGQGYYLGRPGFPRVHPEPVLSARINGKGGSRNELKCSIPVEQLAVAAHSVVPSARVSEVKELLQGKDPISAIVVAKENRPAGLIMSHHMDRALSTRYGMSLYYHRDVSRIMDSTPLVVDGDTPVENVARAAMNREKYKIYDHIIVTRKGLLDGIVSVQSILDTLASVQVEMAKGASPLTGLPGNVSIEQELTKRSNSGEPFSIIYADLDYFKAYNDAYGFKDGDNIILLISRILLWSIKRHGKHDDDFIGHVGGDDFVLVVRQERAERVCRAIVRTFGRLVRYRFTQEDRDRGYILSRDREGSYGRVPLVSVSLAIVDCLGQCGLESLGHRSAEMKKYAKTIPGNSWVRDRRTIMEGSCCSSSEGSGSLEGMEFLPRL